MISETTIDGGTDVPRVYTKLPLGVVNVIEKSAEACPGHVSTSAATPDYMADKKQSLLENNPQLKCRTQILKIIVVFVSMK